MRLKEVFSFLEWWPKLLNKDIVYSDILAGITVALILVPQSMAYAWLAGLPLEVWLYTAFIPIIVAALFGSSYQMSTWPVTIVSLMTATALAPIAVSWTEWYIVYASLLALFIWLFYLLLWVLRLGILVDFLSHPVIIGFTNAIAIITIVSQVPKILWVSVSKWSDFFTYFYNILIAIFDKIHFATFAFWVWAIVFLWLLAKFTPKLPRILIILVVSILFSYYSRDLNLGVQIVWNISNSLPEFSIPFLSEYVVWAFSFTQLLNLLIMAMIIWLIGFTESISVAKFVSTQTKQRLKPNRELIGQWLANISSGLFWGFWVAWSFSKTAVNMRSWAKTGFASVVAWIIVWLTIVYLTPYLYYLPKAILAAIIIVAVSHLIKIKPIMHAFNSDKHEWFIAVITFVLTLFLSPNVELGILIWIILSLSIFVYRTMRPKLAEVSMYKDGVLRDSDLFWLKESKNVSVLRFDHSLYFANAWHFEQSVLDHIVEKDKLKYIVLDMELVNNIDYTWQEILETLIMRLKETWIKVYLTDLRIKVIEKFTKTWFIKRFWDDNIFLTVEDAIDKIKDKHWKDIDLKAIKEYKPDKDKDPILEKKLIKKIEKTNS